MTSLHAASLVGGSRSRVRRRLTGLVLVAAAALPSLVMGAPGRAADPAGASPSAVPVDAAAGAPSASASAAPSPSPVPTPEPTKRPRPAQSLPPLQPLPRLDPAAARPPLAREVVAYLPYWMANGAFQTAPRYDPDKDPWLRDRRITDLVLFSVGIRRDGSLKLDDANARFVLSDRATRIIKAAHARGIRVLVSFVSGGYDNNAALFKDPDAPARFVKEAAALVALRGLDGADLDVELIKKPRFARYAWTAGLLKARLRAENPAARVTVATNGSRSGATMAAMALAQGADRAFLMGYAYRSAGSSPVGSISPLDHPGDLDLLDSLELYRARGIDPARVIMGLPTYGMTWPTDGPAPNAERATAKRLGSGQVTSFHLAFEGAQPFGARWDTVASDPSARRTWYDAADRSWWQTYVDTPATWREKVVAALREGFGGIGLWALGYSGGLTGYPDMVGEVLGRPVVASGSATPAVTADLDVRLDLETLDVLAPTRWVQLSNDGSTWSPPLPPGALSGVRWRLAEGEDGARTVLARSRDAAGRLSAPFAIPVTVDRQGPVVEGPFLTPVDGGRRISFAQHDATGYRPVQMRVRVGDGAWGPWHPIRTAGDTLVQAADGVPVEVQLEAGDPLGNTTLASGSAA
ncbi:MAG: glycoside hydrolase family 18 protein [Chloroflexota bacterium]